VPPTLPQWAMALRCSGYRRIPRYNENPYAHVWLEKNLSSQPSHLVGVREPRLREWKARTRALTINLAASLAADGLVADGVQANPRHRIARRTFTQACRSVATRLSDGRM
jgi:hypothetical protein